jgi:hypothetical protein
MFKLINVETKEETESNFVPKDFTGIADFVGTTFDLFDGTTFWYKNGKCYSFISKNNLIGWKEVDNL